VKNIRPALIIAAAVVVLAAVGVTGAVVLDRVNKITTPPPQTSATQTPCRQPEKVYLAFTTDADMEKVAAQLAGDSRFASMTTETRAQAYARAKEVFKDRPDLLKVLDPDSLSPAIHGQPAPNLTAAKLADQLRPELPLAKEVKPEQLPC
jgi:cell division protein FtsX